ncbi:MAG: hypothetical protein ACREQ5_01790 [Candidatus Dormibacteria bacterium]
MEGTTSQVTAPDVILTVQTKGDAVRAAFAALGKRDVPAALAWLASRNVIVDASTAYGVRRALTLRELAGGDR